MCQFEHINILNENELNLDLWSNLEFLKKELFNILVLFLYNLSYAFQFVPIEENNIKEKLISAKILQLLKRILKLEYFEFKENENLKNCLISVCRMVYKYFPSEVFFLHYVNIFLLYDLTILFYTM
jgi:hypothetical protein